MNDRKLANLDDMGKTIFNSRVTYGTAISLISYGAQTFFDMSLDQHSLVFILDQLGIVFGAGLAIWGRIDAKEVIRL